MANNYGKISGFNEKVYYDLKGGTNMKQTTKNILGVAGVISAVVGVVVAIPALLQEKYLVATLSVMLIVAGLVLLAISFGD